ncbi:MAG: GFA family protein [Pseudomonadota bacterium]
MTSFNATGGCSCKETHYTISGTPMFRAYCHCSTCQAYNQSDFADIIVMRSKDVLLVGQEKIAYKYHQQPPLLQRGNCTECGGVIIEKMRIPLLANMTIIPTQTLRDRENLPAPSFHMFYHRRIADAVEKLPKHEGYLKSQMAFSAKVLASLVPR